MVVVSVAPWLLLLSLKSAASSPLVGRWDAETRSRGGLGAWLELSPDGSCTESFGAMLDGSWRLSGENLTIETLDADGKPHARSAAATVNDNVQTQTANLVTRRLTRVGQRDSGTPWLVGVWSYPHPAGGVAYEQYSSDGRYLFRLPLSAKPCTWTATGSRLQIVVDKKARTLEWRLAADRLQLEGSSQASFRREEANIIPPASQR
jgi:hypothetical protein